MEVFLKRGYKSGVPANLYIPIVDVRDVAEAHIKAATLDVKHDRYLMVAQNLSLFEIAQSFNFSYVKNKSHASLLTKKLPKREIPKFLVLLVSSKKKYLKKNIGYKLEFNTGRIEKKLRINFRDVSLTLNEHAQQLYEDHLIQDMFG